MDKNTDLGYEISMMILNLSVIDFKSSCSPVEAFYADTLSSSCKKMTAYCQVFSLYPSLPFNPERMLRRASDYSPSHFYVQHLRRFSLYRLHHPSVAHFPALRV